MEKQFVYILIDAPSQGMRDNGVMGVYTTLELAEKAKGDRWISIVKIELDVCYNEGIRQLSINQIINSMENKIYFSKCNNHSLFEEDINSPHKQTGGVIWCLACKHQKKCLEDSRKIDKYEIGRKLIYNGLDGTENINAEIIEAKNIKWCDADNDVFVIKLEKADKHNCTIIETRKTFSPYNLTAL